jgi:hypothetical protein
MTLAHGYDFSAYQGNTVPKGAFGWVKTTEGTGYRNAKFDKQWASAQANWEVPGVYHYAHPEQSSPMEQIAMIASMVSPKAGRNQVMLDLEASKLTQKRTNEWAREFGTRLWERFPGVKTVLYAGSGYAMNGTGKGLANFFDFWCYPQYPNAYQIAPATFGVMTLDEARAINRSSLDPRRYRLSAPTAKWPASMGEMWLPAAAKANTGWKDGPQYWQFTDHHSPNGIDASVSSLTVAQMLGAGIAPLEEMEMYGGPLDPGTYEDASVPHKSLKAFGIYCSSTEATHYRLEVNNKDAQTVDVYEGTVGGPRLAKGGVKKKVISLKTKDDIDGFKLENLGPAKFGWDAS